MSTAATSLDLEKRFPGVTPRDSADCPAFNVPTADIVRVLTALRDDFGYDMLVDIAGIDWGESASPRFAVAYHVLSTEKAAYVRLVAPCSGDAEPSIPSVAGVYPAADWHEREAYDMFGIRFEGHPDLRRILMWEGYPYHPLRKDFPLAGIETDLPDDEVAGETGVRVKPAPMAGGPFVAPQAGHMTSREPRARDESWNEKSEKPAD
ncbi:MAG: NADH-quinone oxidoreductase subunit C [Verrucomicrobia bacterium]|nr:MAG: NADH-quinone oxidoreductase subunit C [Verrucomicrobiota bacterium]